MAYKFDNFSNACSKLDKIGFLVIEEPDDFGAKASCYVYLAGGSVRVEVPNEDNQIDNLVDLIEGDLMAAKSSFDRIIKYTDWDMVKERGW